MFDEHYSLYLQCFPDYPVTKALFDEKLCPEKGQLFERRKDGKLIGFLLMHENSIPVLCVDSAYRRQGIGSGLLEEAEDLAVKNGIQKIVLGCGPYYLLQGVPADTPDVAAFFRKRGYDALWSSVDMSLPLGDFSVEKMNIHPLPSGVSFRFAQEEDRDAVVDAVLHAEPNWREIFETCVDPVFVAEENGKIVGFQILSADGAYYSKPGEKIGAVGCVGVVESARERGIGLQMVAAGIEWLQDKGCQEIELRYVELVDWYAKLGFTVKHRQWMGEKAL